MNQAEKNNILDQHKSIYDGYKTNFGSNSEQPLFVQDFANDKNGITVNGKGDVSVYKNMNINESDAFTGAKYLPDETFDFGGPDEYVTMGEQLDKIGDGDDDLEHGTFGDDEKYLPKFKMRKRFFDDEDYLEREWEDEESNFDEKDIEIFDEIEEEEEKQKIKEQVDKSLDMFKRFKKYL
jgi:hypothetical protein